MADRITIDVEARFVDHVSTGMNAAAKNASKLNKELDQISKKKVKPKLGVDDNAFTKKIREAQSKAEKLGRTKVAATLGAVDKATAKIGQVTGAAKAFGSKVFKGTLSMADKASRVIGSVTGAARSFAGRTFSAAVKIKDYATTPLRKIKESLFSIKTLIATITAGIAAKQFIVNPINLADQYSNAKIGFSTLLGETEGQKMMNEIDEFAKATPFKTSNVISNVQKMMAYGWDASRVLKDMDTIGDAAAATGKGDAGLESIVYALSEIRSKGKLSTQELNQLASAGIKAKQYLAQGLGYGTDDAGMAKLMEDLEDGAVGANQAIELILQGMQEFDGMMDKTANETAEGLWSQIEDTFEINVFRRWGQGLQDGAKKGFGTIVDLLNSSEGALQNFGDLMYDIGKEVSNWAADKLKNLVELVKEISQTQAFKDADLFGKIRILWDEIIAEPFSEWWNTKGKVWIKEKASSIGKGLGSGITTGLLAILGVDVVGTAKEGASIGASFAKGFSEGFDGSAITDALVKAISDVWKALPTWAKFLIGSYGVGKVASGIGTVVNGVGTLVGGARSLAPLIGSTGNAMVNGTGLLNILASAGYAVTGGAAGSTMAGGTAALVGGATIAGGLAAGVSAGKGAYDLYNAYKAYKIGDKTEAKANAASGGATLGGVAAGAAIGTAILPGVGTVIGAGIGGIVGWIGGDAWAENIREADRELEAAKYNSEKMKEAIMDTELSAEELEKVFNDVCWEDVKNRFGEIELSMAEIEKYASSFVFDKSAEGMEKFSNASAQAKQSISNFKSAAADMDRLNFDLNERLWKFNMGLDSGLTEEEVEQVKARVQNYIDSAEKVLSDRHYQFNAAVELLIQPKKGKSSKEAYNRIVNSGNGLYAQLQKELDAQSKKLTSTYELYISDGIITVDEQKIISEMQQKIAEITEKVSNSETEASFTVSKLKFKASDLTAESFQEFQASLQTQMDSYIADQDKALTIALTDLHLQLTDGTILEDEYNAQVEALVEGYNTNIDTMTARVNKVQLEGLAEAYDGVGTAEELQAAIEAVLKDGKKPIDVTFDDINAHLNVSDGVLDETAKTTFMTNLQEVMNTAFTGENALTTPVEAIAEVTGVENTEEEVKSEVIGDGWIWATDIWLSTNPLGTGGISLEQEGLNGRSAYDMMLDTTFETPFSKTADVYVTPNWIWSDTSLTLPNTNPFVSAQGAANNANGNIIQSKTLSWVGEEGPEAIIPLVPGRRTRGLQLWEKAGRMLGVQYHANGGIVGGSYSEPIQTFNSEIPAGDKKIEINMGGVTIEIKADGSKPMVENIEDQEQEIAEKVAEIFKNVFSAQFANMPLKGGA